MNLPSIYKQVTYIETDGHQYIDTGVLASSYTDPITYELRCTITGRAGSGKTDYFWGATDGTNRSGYLGLAPGSYSTYGSVGLFCGTTGDIIKNDKNITIYIYKQAGA